MLRNLHIRNLALIREVDVDFTDGLNILTGETGAGKSIIIDSIGLALGGRSQRDLVRSGQTGLAELVFETDDPGVLESVRAMDVEPENGVILISRKIQDGRSTIRVNGETTMITPAASFYKTPGKGINHVRIAYVLEVEELKKAMNILAKGLEAYPGRTI